MDTIKVHFPVRTALPHRRIPLWVPLVLMLIPLLLAPLLRSGAPESIARRLVSAASASAMQLPPTPEVAILPAAVPETPQPRPEPTPGNPATPHVDPVCGRTLAATDSQWIITLGDARVHFHSDECLSQFYRYPTRYGHVRVRVEVDAVSAAPPARVPRPAPTRPPQRVAPPVAGPAKKPISVTSTPDANAPPSVEESYGLGGDHPQIPHEPALMMPYHTR